MKTIYKGSKFCIVWDIYHATTRTPFDFTGKTVDVWLSSINHEAIPISYKVVGNKIEADVMANTLHVGAYSIVCRCQTLEEQAYISYNNAFAISNMPYFCGSLEEQVLITSFASHITPSAIFSQFNSIYVQYQGSPEATRNSIPVEMRRAGLTITYMNMDSETITERASSAVQKDNDHWGLDVNWSRIDELSLSGDIAVSAQGTWIINGVDTRIKAVGPKGDNGLTPWLKTIDNKLHYSYDNETWEECSDYLVHYFRFNVTSSDSQSGTIGKIQISKDKKTWIDLSPEFRNYLRIQGYVATASALPANQAVGTIYGVGPTYDAADTGKTNPIYRIYVYNGTQWIDNGQFTSIAAGVVQETGDSETEVMSQKAVSENLSELSSKFGYGTLTLNLTKNHSSLDDQIDIDLNEGDILFLKFRDYTNIKNITVYLYNSVTGDSTSQHVNLPELTKIKISSKFNKLGLWLEIEGEAAITMEYNVSRTFLSSGVIGITGTDSRKSYPDVNSKTGDVTISSAVTLLINGVHFNVSPQTFNIKNGIPSSITKLVYNINTGLCYAKVYTSPLESDEVVIGAARTRWTSDGSFVEFYHLSLPFEYSIDGKTIHTELTDLESKIGNFFLRGAGDTGVSYKFSNVIAGHTYRIYCKNPNWDVSTLTIDPSQAIFEIYTSSNSVTAYHKVTLADKGTVKDFYDVTIPNDFEPTSKLVVYLRADKDLDIYFSIEDITHFSDLQNSAGCSYFTGADDRFVSFKFRGIAGNRYKITPLSRSWNIPSNISDGSSILFVGAHTSSGSTTLKSYTKGQEIPKSYAFDYKKEYNDIYIGGRAVMNEKVFFVIEDITEQSYNDRIVLEGDNNNGVTSRVLLSKGVEYVVHLPEEKWGTDNINIDYSYYYYELYYTKSGASSVTVINGLLSDKEYKNRFVFTAPETTYYTIYIRANAGVRVPIFISQNAIANPATVYDGQLSKIRSLGFKRLPNNVSEEYVPNLVFMHMSDTHCTKTMYHEPFKKSIELFNKVSGGDLYYGNALKFILHTGDTRNAYYTDGFDFFSDITKDLKKNIYITPGNHDVGFGMDATKAGTDEQIYEQMVAPMLGKWLLNSDGTDSPHIDGKNYYFNDFTEEKVRLIVLYEYESDYELDSSDSTKFKYNRDYRAFRQSQIDWFIQTLKNTPKGYGVIIAKHQPEAVNGYTDNPFYSNLLTERVKMQTYCGANLIADIVQAFIDRTSINMSIEQTGGVVTTLNVIADFSSLESSEFICYCSGHTHLDMVTKLKDYPKQIELNIGPNNIHYTDGTDIYQNGEGVTELLTNVYSIDRNRGCIYIVRLGANFSNTAQYRDFISLKYK